MRLAALLVLLGCGPGGRSSSDAGDDAPPTDAAADASRLDAAPGFFAPQLEVVTGANPFDVIAADFNRDDIRDLAVVHRSPDTIGILLGTTTPGGIPTFAPQLDLVITDTSSQLAIADLNGDGRTDLVVASGNAVSVFLNTMPTGAMTPSFSLRQDLSVVGDPTAIAIADINGDGKPDLAVATASNTVAVFLNTTTAGAATASFAAEVAFGATVTPSGIAFGDVNSDGKPDLAATGNDSSVVSVLINLTPTGGAAPMFTPKSDLATRPLPIGVAFGDIDGDGRPDLAVANDASVSVFLDRTTAGSTAPVFAPRLDFGAAAFPYDVALGDLNRDGRLDACAASVSGAAISCLMNTGMSTPVFGPRQDFATGIGPMSLLLVDINDDGKLDAITANEGATATDGSISILVAL